jgi:peptidoglycan/LPS O-acetylase OafA/YrhL
MMRRAHFQGADGVRAFACLIVLCVHSVAVVIPQSYPYLTGCGKIGVWLFFVLSAFLLTSKLISHDFSATTLVDYGIGRILRIYPAYAIAVFGYWYFGTAYIDTLGDVKDALLLRKGYAHLWTVPVEFKAYVALPFVALVLVFAKRQFGHGGAWVAAIALISGHQLFYPYWNLEENTIETIWYLPSFVIGAITAVAYEQINSAVSDRSKMAIAIGIMLLVAAASPGFRMYCCGQLPGRDLMNKFIQFSLAWAIFIAVMAQGQSILHRVFCHRWLVYIGGWSYSIYLVHWYFVIKIAAIAPGSVIAALSVVVVSIGFGAAMHYVVEKPCETLRRWLSSRV